MRKCQRCGSEIDKDMIVCPNCGEELQLLKAQSKFEFVNIHFLRWLECLALIFPLIGFIIGYCMKRKSAFISKNVIKFSIVGVALWAMLFFLAFICLLALILSGISLF
ncbi:MAG: zinc ribbon domain-containing protein [Clostridia bacterium]|nr:zinc ribbon domain-containing protein [Clostridia bacterium]MDE7329180.1 zinc ribbon domain-containing protein [Clostridia bacterium]